MKEIYKLLFKAFKISFSSKVFWFFGILFALISGFVSALQSFLTEERYSLFISKITGIAQNKPLVFLGGLVFVAVVAAFGLWIWFVLKIALIYLPSRVNLGEKQASLKEGWDMGKKYFWRVLIFDAITITATLLVLMLLFSPLSYLYRARAYTPAVILTIIALLICIPFILTMFFIQNYGYRKIVLDGKTVIRAIIEGYDLFTEKWQFSVGMFFAYFYAIFYGLFIFLTFVLVFSAPVGILLLALKRAEIIDVLDVFAISAIFLLPIGIGLLSFLDIYNFSLWTIVYQKLAKEYNPEENFNNEIAS
ncbi:MAG: hypothetical protein V1770_02510 [bacterium]